VFQGVAPPAQLRRVPDRMRYADVTVPLALNRSADAPPFGAATSAFDT
jgi:hypothetical protein